MSNAGRVPGKLWSLWDIMFQLPLGKMVEAHSYIHGLAQLMRDHNRSGEKWLSIDVTDFRRRIDAAQFLADNCGELGFAVSKHSIGKLLIELARPTILDGASVVAMDQAITSQLEATAFAASCCFMDEAHSKFGLILEARESELCQPKEPHFGHEVASKFPRASYDIDEAGKCLGFGRSTACVFHLMRVMEIGLKAVAQCIGAIPPKNPNWKLWLDAINDARVARSPKGSPKWGENDLFQDFYQRLDAVREAQRNSTLHVERVYTEPEAREVFAATRSFIQKIASRMDEDGERKA